MKYIQKVDVPQFFSNDTKDLTSWDEYKNGKEKLREYILKNEQNYLCIYCETKISSDKSNSHLEHIKPKAQDKYPELTFEYNNIAVSCEGNCQNQEENSTRNNCGHKKLNEYDEDKFLNPLEVQDIREYFEYNIDDFSNYSIASSDKNKTTANYMINTLHLNDGGLANARTIALETFKTKMKRYTDIKIRKEKIVEKLNKENIAQISFLKYKFQNILNYEEGR